MTARTRGRKGERLTAAGYNGHHGPWRQAHPRFPESIRYAVDMEWLEARKEGQMMVKTRLLVLLCTATALLIAGATTPAIAQEALAQPAVTTALLQSLDTSQGSGSASAESSSMAASGSETGSEPITVKVGGKETLTLKGFVSATFFAQDQNFSFGNGQNAEWPTPPQYETNKWFSGGDVRNTRLTLAFNGPETAEGWKMGALVEADFFGGFNGTGAFSHQQAVQRLRLAYVDLTNGGTTLRIGQFWSPFFGEVPASLSHIAFPLGYGSAGMVGWRFPGLFLYQDLSGKGSSIKSKLTVAVFEGSWDGPGSPIANQSAGNVGFRNQVEARFDLDGKSGNSAWGLYVAGHWDDKDLTGVNDVAPAGSHGVKSLTGTGVELGGHYKIGSFLIHGNLYTTKATGQQFSAITQFGDIKDQGGWLQLGYNIDKRWSVYGFYGMADPNDKDVMEWVGSGGRIKNTQGAFMVEWSLGQYQLGLEYLHDEVTMATNDKVKGNQIALSARYLF
jgi:hypothetical protein